MAVEGRVVFLRFLTVVVNDRIADIDPHESPLRGVIFEHTAYINVEEFGVSERLPRKKRLARRYLLDPRSYRIAIEMDEPRANLPKYSEPFRPLPYLWTEQHLELVSTRIWGLVYQRRSRDVVLLEKPIRLYIET
ncbi:MAG TPA: hypothetical protein PLR83_05130 [Pyrinomonadaceae bacterium]|nr:hypothetical protein [Pyrinomonadaceae bacterium]